MRVGSIHHVRKVAVIVDPDGLQYDYIELCTPADEYAFVQGAEVEHVNGEWRLSLRHLEGRSWFDRQIAKLLNWLGALWVRC